MKSLKKAICYLLMFAMLFTTWGMTEVQAADDVSVSGATYPDWIKKGGVFVLKGTVRSGSVITELTASLNDGHNNVMYSKTVRPNSTQYNLSGIDAAMRFDKLSANPYTYQVKVRNSSGLHTVIMKPFTVYSGSKPSFATGLDTSAKYRLCVKEDSSMVADIAGRGCGSNALVKKDNGQSTANWYLEYAGSSAYMIKNADTGLYLDVADGGYRNGTNVQIWTKNSTEAQCWYFIPDGGSYKIISKKNYLTLSLENSLALNKPNLDIWRDLGVAHQRFILKRTGGSATASTLRISGANTVPTLNEGQVCSLKGTVMSNYKITKVQADIYNQNGTSVVRKTIYPNSTSASLAGAIDNAMTFNKLSAGTYRYSIWAEDASGCQKTLIWQQFEVKAVSKKNKTLSVNWTNIKKVGNQAGKKNGKSSDSCGRFALAYTRTILDKKVHYWSEYDAHGGKTQYDALANWPKAKYASKTASSAASVYKLAYDSINAGKPFIVHVKGKRSTWHYITIVGYQNVTSTNSLSPSNFLIIDSCPGTTKAKAENMGTVGYSLYNKSGKYQYIMAK